MKQKAYSLLLAILVFIISITTSCKKNTYECRAYNLNTPEPGGYSTFTVKRKDKAKMCTDRTTQPDSFGNYTTCVIK